MLHHFNVSQNFSFLPLHDGFMLYSLLTKWLWREVNEIPVHEMMQCMKIVQSSNVHRYTLIVTLWKESHEKQFRAWPTLHLNTYLLQSCPIDKTFDDIKIFLRNCNSHLMWYNLNASTHTHTHTYIQNNQVKSYVRLFHNAKSYLK